MGFIKDWPVVVCVIDPQDDLSDGRETAFVLGRDVQDVGGQGLNLNSSEGESIMEAIFIIKCPPLAKSLLSAFKGFCIVGFP